MKHTIPHTNVARQVQKWWGITHYFLCQQWQLAGILTFRNNNNMKVQQDWNNFWWRALWERCFYLILSFFTLWVQYWTGIFDTLPGRMWFNLWLVIQGYRAKRLAVWRLKIRVREGRGNSDNHLYWSVCVRGKTAGSRAADHEWLLILS